MSHEAVSSLMNNVYLSIMTERGSFFQDRDFGMRRLVRAKNTERNALLAQSYAEDALAWIIDSGRASKIDVATEINKSESLYRCKLLVEVTDPGGNTVTFELFKEVA